jgi:mono/diheme cytochrome c family protein
LLSLGIIGSIALCLPSIGKKSEPRIIDGEQVFKQYCASCHIGGGNRVKPGRPVAGSRELATIMAFKSYLSAPPGHMPYYRSVVGDQKMLEALYKYCKQLTKPTKQAFGGQASSI